MPLYMLNHFIWTIVYPFICSLILMIIQLLPSENKLRQWLEKRKLTPITLNSYKPEKRTILFSCASLGEFETVKSLILKLKTEFNIHLSFFSPSGYDRLLNAPDYYDILSYSPTESNLSLEAFFTHHAIDAAVISGNDLWPNFLRHLNSLIIPYTYVGMTILPKSFLHHWFIKANSSLLVKSKHIFSHSKETISYLSELGVNVMTYNTHPRWHSINEDAQNAKLDQRILDFAQRNKILIMGSTHSKDEELLISIYKELSGEIKTIIVPHDIESEHIKSLKRRLPSSKIWSESTDLTDCQILIIDKMGMLKDLYSIADITYIGGGFDKGIHNIMEAAIYYKPILFGPKYHKFPEAQQLIDCGMAVPVSNQQEFLTSIKKSIERTIDKDKFEKMAGLNRVDSDLDTMIQSIRSMIYK